MLLVTSPVGDPFHGGAHLVDVAELMGNPQALPGILSGLPTSFMVPL